MNWLLLVVMVVEVVLVRMVGPVYWLSSQVMNGFNYFNQYNFYNQLQNRNPFNNRFSPCNYADKVKTACQFITDGVGEALFARTDALRNQGDHFITQNIHYFNRNQGIA